MKKILCIILIITMMTGLVSCGSANEEPITNAGEVIEETDDSLIIIDQAGREVVVPKDIDSIALCYRVVIRFLLCLDQGDKIKGIGKNEEFLTMLQPSLTECKDVGKGVADIEALAELNPDIFFHKASDIKTLDAVEKIGIPAVAIDVETPEQMITTIRMMGRIFDVEDKAAELIEYYDSKLLEFEDAASSFDDDDKKTAIMMGATLGEVADGSMLQSRMIEYAGGINPAKDIEATELWPTAGVEQIFKWNPDYIFITNRENPVYTAEEVMAKPEWQELKAVKNKNVFVMPAEVDSWELPGIASVLGMEYMMKTMYPQTVTEDKYVEDVSEFYKLSYGREFTRDELGY